MTATSAAPAGRVLVTGAGGFVGTHLVTALRRAGAEVVALTRAECDLTRADQVRRVVGDVAPDVLLHLAAARANESSAARAATTAVNTMSGAWLVDAVPDSCRVVVRLGSSTEYAASPDPMGEDTPLHPRGYFGATKAAGSLLFAATAQARGIRAVVLRPFQVYGPGDKPTRFVPAVLDAARHGHPLRLTAPGLRRDWVWVGDVVDACVRAVQRDDLPAAALYNLGTGTQTANEDLVALAEQVTGTTIDVRVGAHPGRSWDTPSWVCDPAAARAELGWEPRVALADGLRRCWDAP